MRAEAEYTASGWDAWRWALGCTAVLAWEWLLDGVAVRLRSGERMLVGALAGKEKSMRRALIAVAIVAVTSVAFWMMPSGRQVLGTAWLFVRSGNMNSILPSQRKVEQWRKKALATKNARLLTFVALMEKNPTDALAAADAAVEIDGSCAWVYTQLALRDAKSPASEQLLKRAEQDDGDNGAVLVQEAAFSVKHWTPIEAANTPRLYWYGTRKTLAADPMEPWKSTMWRGITAKKFTTYGDEYAKLMTWAAKAGYLAGPQELMFALARQGMLDLGNVVNFATYSVRDTSGSPTEQRARDLQVAAFGERVNTTGETELERMMGSYVEMVSYDRLSTPELSGEYAALFAARLQALKDTLAHRSDSSLYQLDGMMTWNAQMVEIAVMLAAASLVVLLLMVLRLAMRRIGGRTVVTLWASVAAFVGSCVLCVVAYEPFAALYESALRSSGEIQHYKLYLLLMSFGSTPLVHVIFQAMVTMQIFWFVFVLLLLGVAWIGGHEAVRRARRRAEA